jgi:hypothetical protein
MTDPTAPSSTDNKRTVQVLWEALYQRDWDRIGSCFGPDSEYTDVPSPADDVAHGPEQIVARLRLGLEKVDAYEHQLRLMADFKVADLSLAEFGRKEIELAEHEMPGA